MPIQIHLAETRPRSGCRRSATRCGPVAILDSLNFWAPITIGAHGVWINDDEIALLKQRNVGISNNPESNMKLSSGTAPVMEYRKAGVNVGLGTDGAASNNDLDMFEAMRQAAFQQKLVTMDPTAISAPEALEMATHRRRPRDRPAGQRLGSLEPGKLADLIIVGMSKPRQQPLFDPVSQIVYASRGDDVETTIVNGKVLMRDRQGADARRGERAQRGPHGRGPRAEGRASRGRAFSVRPMDVTRARRCRAGCDIARRSRGRSRRRTCPRS